MDISLVGIVALMCSCLWTTLAYDVDVARRICAVGKSRAVSDFVMLAAIETCIVESGCRNLNHGDRDSLGVFQQRASWGSVANRMNVEWAAGKFFDGTGNCQRSTSGQMAQCVQRSAFPAKYDQNEGNARTLMAQAGCSSGVSHVPGRPQNEAPCSSVGHCYNRDGGQCNGKAEERVNGQFACPSQPDNIVCCVGGGTSSSSVANEHPCSSVGHCYNRDVAKCNGRAEEKVNGAFACPSQPDNIVCCVTGGSDSGVPNEHPCSTVGKCYDTSTGSCPTERQAVKVGGEWSCPSQSDNIICCRNEGGGGGKPAATEGMVPNESPCRDAGFCFDESTHSCPSGRSGPTMSDGRFVCPTQSDSVICCFH